MYDERLQVNATLALVSNERQPYLLLRLCSPIIHQPITTDHQVARGLDVQRTHHDENAGVSLRFTSNHPVSCPTSGFPLSA